MLFRRRNKEALWRRFSGWLWPRSGVTRAWKYLFHRVARMPGSTHNIAAGIASGAAISFTPFLGLHLILGAIIAWMLRGNILASVFGTAVGNPWTFPLIFALTGNVGAFLLGREASDQMPSWDTMWDSPVEYFASIFPPLFVGGIPVAILVWLIFYVSFRGLISGYRESRRRRRDMRRENQKEDAQQ